MPDTPAQPAAEPAAAETPPADPPASPPVEPTDDTFVDDNAEPGRFSIGDEPKPEATKPAPAAGATEPAEEDQNVLKVVDERMDSVNQRLDAVTDRLYKQAVEGEVNQILATNPEYKPYEARIRRFVTHPNRYGLIKQGLPVHTVVLEALAPHLQQIGAAKARAADEKANQTRVSGESPTPTPGSGLPDYTTMSNEEITKMAELVKSGRYKPS